MKYRYVMIQKKIKEGDWNAQILIEDPDKPIGKRRIENEIEQGGNIVGWIDTDCPRTYIQNGMKFSEMKKLDEIKSTVRNILDVRKVSVMCRAYARITPPIY